MTGLSGVLTSLVVVGCQHHWFGWSVSITCLGGVLTSLVVVEW